MPVTDFRDPVFDAIRSYFEQEWIYTPIRWPNEGFDQGNEEDWVSVEVFDNIDGQQSFGMDQQRDNRWDIRGQVWFHIFVRRGNGVSSARGAARKIVDLFRGKRMLGDDLTFEDASVDSSGSGAADADGIWFRISVDIQWIYRNAFSNEI